LDVQRFVGGRYRACLLGESFDTARANFVSFVDVDAAQRFVSWWYAPNRDVLNGWR